MTSTRGKIKCLTEGCEFKTHAKGLCRHCYGLESRFKHGGLDPKWRIREELNSEIDCVVMYLKDAHEFLERVTGFTTRMSWRYRIREAELEKRRLEKELNRARSPRN